MPTFMGCKRENTCVPHTSAPFLELCLTLLQQSLVAGRLLLLFLVPLLPLLSCQLFIDRHNVLNGLGTKQTDTENLKPVN